MSRLQRVLVVAALAVVTASGPVTAQVPDAATVSAALGGAADDGARRQLIEANPGWMSPAVLQAVLEGARAADNPDLARAGFVAAVALADRLGDARSLGQASEGLGFLLFQQGRIAEAVAAQERGVPAAEQAGDQDTLIDLLRYLAAGRRLLGALALAESTADRALTMARAQKNGRQIANLLGDMGLIAQDVGDLRRRDALFQEAVETAEANHLPKVVRYLFQNIGAAYIGQGDLEVGTGYLRRAIAAADPTGEGAAVLAFAYANLGVAELRLGRLEEARAAYEQAETRFTQMGDQIGVTLARNNLGELARFRGDDAASKTMLEGVVRAFDELQVGEGRSEARINLAWALLNLGEVEAARAVAAEAVTIARGNRQVDQVSKALAALGEATRRLGRTAEARNLLEEAIALVETTRRNLAGAGAGGQGFLEDYVAPYHALVALSVDEGRARDGLAAAERTKARQLFDMLHPGRHEITRSMSPAERSEEVQLARTVSERQVALAQVEPAATRAAEGELADAIGRLESFRATLYRTHPELRFQRGDLAPVDESALTALVPDPGTALVEFVVAERETFAFVITRGADGHPVTTAHQIALPRLDLQREVAIFRDQVASRDLAVRRSARALYDRLIGPIAPRLRGRSVVALVPDGPLWGLPFAALVAPSGRYVLDDHALFLAPSLTALAMLHGRPARAASPTLLAVAAPTPGTTPLPVAPLPHTAREVASLGRVYGARASRIVRGADAREDHWKQEAGHYRVLHLATHGVLNSASPLYSYLVLGKGDGGDDGLLEAREVMDLSLAADVAVLSACETGGGRFRYGEGQVGMSWAFQVAGVPTTVVSQWKVDEASTARLMTAFHQALVSSGRASLPSRARALRQAARQVAQSSFSHPFYWAAFTMIGDGY